MRRILLTLPTLGRPRLLDRALDSIERLIVPPCIDLRVLVIDNSPYNDAALQIRSRAARFAHRLDALHEPQPGISAARNAGLILAHVLEVELVGFMDDDQTLHPLWLHEMLFALHLSESDAAINRVEMQGTAPVPWWLDAAWSLDRPRARDLEPVEEGYTGGALVALALIREHALLFDSAYGFTGGEDTVFFSALRAAGGRIVYCARAVAFESFGPERLTLRWFARRWFRDGNGSGVRRIRAHLAPLAARAEPVPAPRYTMRARLLGKGLVRLMLGAPLALAAAPLLLGRVRTSIAALRTACRGAGYVSSAFGHQYEEYRGARLRLELAREPGSYPVSRPPDAPPADQGHPRAAI